MRILVVSNLYPPDFLGGYELGCAQAVNALRQKGHTVVVCTTPSHLSSSAEQEVLRYLELADIYRPSAVGDRRLLDVKSNFISFHNISVLLDIIAWFQPDVLYLWNLLGLGLVGIVSVLNYLDLPWVWHLMDRVPVAMCAPSTRGIDALFQESSRRNFGAGTFIALSRILIDECRSFGIDLGQRLFVLPNWVVGDRTTVSRMLPETPQLRCLYAGNIGEQKGIGLIVEAASELVRGGRTGFLVDLYGPGDPEPYRLAVNREHLQEYINFHGPKDQTELEQLYLSHDVLLFPTWYREPGGFVAFEAAAAGCVPIMSKVCGAAEWLVNNVEVIKIERTSNALARALRSILDGTINLEGLRKRGIWTVRNEFHISRVLPKIEHVLENASRRFSYNARAWQNARVMYNLLDKLASQMACSSPAV